MAEKWIARSSTFFYFIFSSLELKAHRCVHCFFNVQMKNCIMSSYFHSDSKISLVMSNFEGTIFILITSDPFGLLLWFETCR